MKVFLDTNIFLEYFEQRRAINLRDYSAADTSTIEILSPTEFVAKYL